MRESQARTIRRATADPRIGRLTLRRSPLPLSGAFGVKPTDFGLSDDAISLPDTAEREGRLWIRHAERTASPYLRFDQRGRDHDPASSGQEALDDGTHLFRRQ